MYFIEADPGEHVTVPLVIKNSTGVQPTFTSERLDMRSGEGTDSRAFQYLPLGDAPRGAGWWIKPISPRSFTIAPFEQQELDVAIDVPADAGAGGHYAAIMFTAPDPRPDSQVRFDVNQPVAIFITVSGSFEHDVRVTATPSDRWRWKGGRATWDVHLRNEGDVHEPISGRMRVDGLFGGASSARLDAGILFPGEERTQRVEFDLRSAPDLLQGDVRVDLDDAAAVDDAAPRVVVLPIWMLVLLAVALVVVVLRLRMRRRARERRHEVEDDGGADGFGPPS
ncbi:MAG: hypothetical protein JWL76_794 [Thermoleophilia bacterium]|nr:hypothetical protein [Thermoleophilia bacterium]